MTNGHLPPGHLPPEHLPDDHLPAEEDEGVAGAKPEFTPPSPTGAVRIKRFYVVEVDGIDYVTNHIGDALAMARDSQNETPEPEVKVRTSRTRVEVTPRADPPLKPSGLLPQTGVRGFI